MVDNLLPFHTPTLLMPTSLQLCCIPENTQNFMTDHLYQEVNAWLKKYKTNSRYDRKDSKQDTFFLVGFYLTPTLYRLYGIFPALPVEEDLRCPSVHYSGTIGHPQSRTINMFRKLGGYQTRQCSVLQLTLTTLPYPMFSV